MSKALLFLPHDGRTNISGPVADALNIARSFALAEIPSILIFNGHPEIFKRFEETGIDVRRIDMPISSAKSHFNPMYRRRFSKLIANLIEQESVDVVHLMHNASYILNYMTKLSVLKVCTQLAATPEPRPIGLFDGGIRLRPRALMNSWYRKYVRYNYRPADLVVCISDAARESAIHTYRVEPDRAVVVRPGILGRCGDSKRGRLRSELGIADDEKVVCSVGRLTAAKGVEDFCEVARTIAARGRRYRFVFVGQERDAAYAREIKDRYGEYVTFIGHRSDMGDVYADTDLLLHLSHREGSPLVVIESLEFGIPCVAWAIPGISEDVEDGVTGTTVPFGDNAAVAEAVEKIFEQPGELERLGSGARDWFKRFSIDDYAKRILAAYASRRSMASRH